MLSHNQELSYSCIHLCSLSYTVTCDPPCQQGAPCISHNVCNCPISYYGERCELGTQNKTHLVCSIWEIFQQLYFLQHHADIDECAVGSHNCEQICNNTVGGFNCSCRDGFILYLDEASCTGTMLKVYSWS